ncbi:polysaccharide biosynthesis protein [Aphanothece hegewaldii CCALA 016]|uniref:Polysaccharide biosynthesis protein n=1 Tax=Aphanothece hegewaldii CCALA 016 TaxID=2107694 RepID=A0A2T1M3L3_9CHRO|nr:oligosaccharide flippase family protein [Aphanothece hegewaldii]PSF39429.1 polysaccharide biosynthesis protein [Aphanothece hegewaldii CCALA 016]
MSSLKKLALLGSLWTLLGYGSSQFIRLGGNVILTRLLAPELFGLMATLMTLIVALNFLSDVGLAPIVVQHKRGDDPIFLNTVWTLQIIRGFFIWFGCLLISWPIAQLYNDERLLWLMPIFSLTSLISGFNSTSLLTLNRQVALKKITILDLGVQSFSLSIMLIWAFLHPTIWALVVGNLISATLTMILSYRLIPNYFNRFAWEQTAARDILSFGKWIFISTAFYFLATQSDRLILAKLTSFEILGIYTIACTLALFPQSVIGMLSSKVLLPVFSQLMDLPRESLRLKMLKNRRLLLLGISCLIIPLVCFGDWLILFMYDARYKQAAWMLPILALGIWPNVLLETNRQALTALGKLNYQAYGQILKSIHMCLGLLLGFYLFGLPGLIIMVALNDLELYAIISYGLWREKLSCFQQDILMTILILSAIILTLTVRKLAGYGLPIDLMFESAH